MARLCIDAVIANDEEQNVQKLQTVRGTGPKETQHVRGDRTGYVRPYDVRRYNPSKK